MTTIKAIVRKGRIEVERPVDLPDGTELTIPLPDQPKTLGIREEDWEDTLEAILDWIRWYDSLEPLEFTPDERAAWEAARQEQKDFELAQWDKRSKRNEGQYPGRRYLLDTNVGCRIGAARPGLEIPGTTATMTPFQHAEA